MPTSLQWVLGGLMVLVVVVYAWYHRHPTFKDLQKGTFNVPEWEVNVLAAILADAEVEPARVLVIETKEDVPYFRPQQHWVADWLDHRLRVLHRFGGYYRHAVAVSEGRVVGLSLGNTSFSEVSLLAELSALRHVRFPETRIAALRGLPDVCSWVVADFSRNQITDATPLLSCTALVRLNLSGNQIDTLPNLNDLKGLEHLDLRMNALTRVTGLAGHPWLRELELYGNRLTQPTGLTRMPQLQWLSLSGNALTALTGLEDLPALRYLQLGGNQLQVLDAEVLAALPALRRVDAQNNNIQVLPEGYRWMSSEQVQPAGGGFPELNLAHNPVVVNRNAIPEPLD